MHIIRRRRVHHRAETVANEMDWLRIVCSERVRQSLTQLRAFRWRILYRWGCPRGRLTPIPRHDIRNACRDAIGPKGFRHIVCQASGSLVSPGGIHPCVSTIVIRPDDGALFAVMFMNVEVVSSKTSSVSPCEPGTGGVNVTSGCRVVCVTGGADGSGASWKFCCAVFAFSVSARAALACVASETCSTYTPPPKAGSA